ncbi:PEP-CTERM sorting domain-containing protein [bacterium]|nr:PEP-CTERM sorting domain-containing protein [bacterium]
MKYRSLFFFSLVILLLAAVDVYPFSQDSSSSIRITTDLSSVQRSPGDEVDAKFQIILQNGSWNHTHFTVELDNVLISTASGTNNVSYDFNDGTVQGFQGDPFEIRIVSGNLEMWTGTLSSYYLQFDDDPDEIFYDTSTYVNFVLPYDCLALSFVINVKQFGVLDFDAALLEVYFVEGLSEPNLGPEFVDPIIPGNPILFTYNPWFDQEALGDPFEYNPLLTVLEETYAVPEPTTICLLLISLSGLARFIRRKK